jgi:2-(1,2-epoxy-1,2-dihydrophenyl)acetyl-CoA isomerase
MDAEEPAVSFETAEGGIAIIGLTRPEKRNAMRQAEWQRIGDLIRACIGDVAVRSIILTGHGGYFSAGADLRLRATNSSRPSALHSTLLEIYHCPKPVIAAVEDCCIGAGWALALACDVVVAGSTAYFQPPFVSRGLIPDAGISWFLEQRLGRYEVARLLWFEGRLDADEAAAHGLVTHVTDTGAALSLAHKLAAQLSTAPARTVAISKSIMRCSSYHSSLESVLEAEYDRISSNAQDQEAIDSRSRFVGALGQTAVGLDSRSFEPR